MPRYSDIDGTSLLTELKTLAKIFPVSERPGNGGTALRVLRYVCENRFVDIMPNIYIALRIFLTTPVTVASGERNFSKLKLTKTYLRSTMAQDRLVNLSLISIENSITRTLNFSELINDFATKKARKVKF